jgi:3-isopropylmalate dehydratase
MSPAMAAAAAVTGHLVDVRQLQVDARRVPTPVALTAEPTSAPGESEEEEPSIVTDAQSHSAGAPTDHVTTSTGLPPFTVLKGVAAPIDRACAAC